MTTDNGHEPKCAECGATIQGAPFDGDKPRPRHCWSCQAAYEPTAEEKVTDLMASIFEGAQQIKREGKLRGES